MTQVIRMKGASGEGMLLKKYEEVIFPYFDLADPACGVKYLEQFQYRNGDMLVCTYPKCGTHWIVNMLLKLRSEDPSDRPKDTNLEFGPPEVFENQKDPRFIYTHQKPSRVYPSHIEGRGKVIIVLRNPKDVAVSFYHHYKTAELYKNKQTWDEFFQSFIEGEVAFGSYFDFVREWEQVLKDIAEGVSKLQLELFYYEDLLLNPKENIVRLNKFLGFNRDDDYMEKVLSETTLESLRELYTQKLSHPICADEKGNSVIFRKGQTGDWKNYFTATQSDTVDKLLKQALQHGIIKFKTEI